MKTISIGVKGKVQGVFFRQSTKEKAVELGVSGYVKNESDGSVKILATGNTAELDKLVEWCWEGPARASVSSVEVNEITLTAFQGFVIWRGDQS
jgi:acylphosphatase